MKRFEDEMYYVAARSRTPGGDAHDILPSDKAKSAVARGSRSLKVAGLFAGIGGLEEGFRQAGLQSAMLCEIDPLARHVLSRHFPDAELESDVKLLSSLPDCDVLTAGFPCQDLSQVGRRQGITGPNSGLVESIFRLLSSKKKAPTWVVLENVPFMLTLDRGAGIRAVTSSLEDLGYNWAYRTVDAAAFGLPQRRRRVILLASKVEDPRPVLLAQDAGAPERRSRGSSACGFYWTEGNTGLGWAIDAVPPLKGGSALHIPSPPAIWFPRRHLIATPAIQDAERMQGFKANWTDIFDVEPTSTRKRWRMVGNAVSVPMAKWIAKRLTTPCKPFHSEEFVELPHDKGWPAAAWGMKGKRSRSTASEWPVRVKPQHLAGFLQYDVEPLSKKATAGFLGRLQKSCLRYEEAFAEDLAYHIANVEKD